MFCQISVNVESAVILPYDLLLSVLSNSKFHVFNEMGQCALSISNWLAANFVLQVLAH